MKAAFIHGRENITIEDKPKPQVDDVNDCLIKVLFCGICGSDLPKYFGNRVKRYPLVLGHEFSGIVEEGPDEWRNKLVAIKPKLYCGECDNCKNGKFNLCLNTKTIGSDIDGGFEEYITINNKYLFDATGLGGKLAALIEPFSIGVHACKFVRKPSRIAIVGNGSIGTMVRLALKYDLGIDDVEVIGRDYPLNTKLDYYDTVFECSGTVGGLNSAIKICKYRSDIIQIGIIYPEYVNNQLEFDKILRKELSIKGSWDSDFTTDWEKAYKYLSEHSAEFEAFVGQEFMLDDINNAFRYKKLTPGISNKKVMVRCFG